MTSDTPRFTLIQPTDRRTYWVGGQRQAVIVGGPETGNRYALSHSTIAVGGGANEHHHSREAEAFYVIAGTLRFTLEGRRLMLEKGSFLHAEPGQKYNFEVVGFTPCEVLILYAPAGLERFIIESGIADPPDEAQSRQAAVRSVEGAHGLMTAAPAYGVRYTAVQKP